MSKINVTVKKNRLTKLIKLISNLLPSLPIVGRNFIFQI